MKLKTKYTYDDLKEFDRLLTKSELKGFDNYARNIGRLELNKFLDQFDKNTQDLMFEQIKEW